VIVVSVVCEDDCFMAEPTTLADGFGRYPTGDGAAATNAPANLREFAFLLWRGKWTILAVAGAVLAAALLVSSRQTTLYDSRSSVLVELPPGTGSSAGVDMATEKLVAGSPAVAKLVVTKLHLRQSPAQVLRGLSIDVPVDSRVLNFDYSHHQPRIAQQLAETFAQSYLTFRQRKQAEESRLSQRALQSQINSLSKSLDDIQKQASTTSNPGQQDVMRTRVASLTAQIGILQEKLVELAQAQQSSPGRIIEDALLPARPSRPNYLVNGVLALLVGLMAGIGAVLVRHYVSDRIQGAKDLELHVRAPVLSTIPAVRTRGEASARLVTMQRPASLAAEAFRHLRANFLAVAGLNTAKTILITSAVEEEGKTFTAANLAVVLAKAGNSVILISADLRRPQIEQVFDISAPAGYADGLENKIRAHDAWLTGMWSVQPNLNVIPVGTAPDNPAELMTSRRMLELIEELQDFADFVLVDAAPLIPVADTASIAPACDAVLMVADARSTTRAMVTKAREQLDQINALVLGAVLVNARSNGVKVRAYGPR
jgi:tyrosine-protein kinase